jgi:hypothetical protein
MQAYVKPKTLTNVYKSIDCFDAMILFIEFE